MRIIVDENLKSKLKDNEYLNKIRQSNTLEIIFSNKTKDDLMILYIKQLTTIINSNTKLDFIYKTYNHILENLDTEYLDKINTHLKNIANASLYIANLDGIKFSYNQTLKANKKLDEILSKIDPDLSNYEKLTLIYEYVTSFHYQEDDKSFINASHWIPVINGNKIVCSGYASLFKTLCDKAFNQSDVKVFLQTLTLTNKNDPTSISKHANNIIFLKDDKYNIDGLFYVDACWDCADENHISKHSFFCIPLKDILYSKYYDFNFNSFIKIYLNQYPEYKNSKTINSVDEIEKIFINPFYIDENDFTEYYNLRFNNIKKYEKIFTNEELKILNKITPNTNPNYKIIKRKRILNYLNFLSTINKLSKQHIPNEAIENSYRSIGIRKGFKGKMLDAYVKQTITREIQIYKQLFDYDKCNHQLTTLSR